MHEFLQQLINGLSVGSIYALIAVGYTMVYGILQLINFAHGDVFMVAPPFFVPPTKIGPALRAVSFRFDTAPLMGIDIDRVISFTFALGSTLAGTAGVLYAIKYPSVDPLMGLLPGVKAFVAAVF